jgi:hypothetical protein
VEASVNVAIATILRQRLQTFGPLPSPMNPPAGNFAEAMNADAELQNFVAGYLEILEMTFWPSGRVS